MSNNHKAELLVRREALRLYTAKEFLATFEPQTLGALLDVERALHDDTIHAQSIADSLGIVTDGRRFTAGIWGMVYP